MAQRRTIAWYSWLALLPGAGLSASVAACSTVESSDGGNVSSPGGCSPEGLTEACYPADASTRGIGLCRDGWRICQDGRWSSCVEAVVPTTELCGDLLDNDCNGLEDEGCPCTAGATKPCYGGPPSTLGIGNCAEGEQRCEDDIWGTECVGEVLPAAEDPCNEIDDDCDGVIEGGPGTPECCTPTCSGVTCGSGDGCGGTCEAGSGCCTPSCASKLCGDGNGCGGTCQAGSGCCSPSCAGASCGGSDGCGGECSGSCPTGYFCNGNLECECGPAPSWVMAGGECLPSCGRLLHDLGLPDTGGGCCATPCVTGTFGGGPGATHDCTYCCASPEPGVATCT